MTRTRRILTLVLLAVVAISVVGPAAATVAQNDTATPTATPTPTPTPTATPDDRPNDPESTAGNESASTDDTGSEWTYSELRREGTIVDERYPSLRTTGPMTAFWAVNYPPKGMGKYGNRGNEEYIEPTTEVHRNKVRIWASHPFDGESRNYTLKKIYWKPDTRRVTLENGTTVERQYANVSGVAEQELNYDSGMRRPADIQLRGHYDQATRVTMILEVPGEENPRWTFKHKSIATSQGVNIQSQGDALEWGFWWIFLPTIALVLFLYKTVPDIRRQALAGTGYGAGPWIGLGAVIAIGSYMFGYYALASLTAHLPLVMPLFVAWCVGFIMLEDDDGRVETWDFMRVDPETATSPLDDKAEILDSGVLERKSWPVVRDEDGNPVLYHKGLLSMWARYKGCYATLDIDNMEAMWEVEGAADYAVIVDKEMDELVKHLPARVIFKWPFRTYKPPRDQNGEVIGEEVDPGKLRVLPEEADRSHWAKLAAMVAFPVGLALLSQQFIDAWQWGALASLPLALTLAEPIEGKAYTKVAPGQARKAWVTAWYIDLNVSRFGVIDEVLSALIEAENQKFDLVEFIEKHKQEGVVDKAHDRDVGPFDTVITDDDPAVDEDSDRELPARKNGQSGGDD